MDTYINKLNKRLDKQAKMLHLYKPISLLIVVFACLDKRFKHKQRQRYWIFGKLSFHHYRDSFAQLRSRGRSIQIEQEYYLLIGRIDWKFSNYVCVVFANVNWVFVKAFVYFSWPLMQNFQNFPKTFRNSIIFIELFRIITKALNKNFTRFPKRS